VGQIEHAVEATTARGGIWRGAVIGGFIAIASLMLTFGRNSHIHDGDSLLPAIMSVQKLTWYYWDQDRFGNLLPFLASPLRPISLNFHVQVILRNVCAFLSLLFVLGLAGHRDHLYQRFFLAVLVTMLAAEPFVGSFFGQGLSQPISCAVFAVGLWWMQPDLRRWWLVLPQWLAAIGLFWLGFFVNLSMIAIMVPCAWILLSLGAGKAGPLGRLPGFTALGIAAAAAWYHARLFEPHTPTDMIPGMDRLNAAAVQMLSQIDLTVIALVLLGAATLAAWLCRRRSLMTAPPVLVLPLGDLAVLATMLLSTVLFANLAWVQWNENMPRYYSVTELCLLVLTASWSITWVLAGSSPPGHVARRPGSFGNLLLPIAALLAVYNHAGWPAPLQFYAEPRDNPFAFGWDIPNILAHVPPAKPMIAVGKFWDAVPLVYARLDAQGMPETYATANHWEPMRPEIADLVRSGRPFTLVCLLTAPADCTAQVLSWSGVDRVLPDADILAQDTLQSGGTYAVLAVGK
jgi:hypothetical protein